MIRLKFTVSLNNFNGSLNTLKALIALTVLVSTISCSSSQAPEPGEPVEIKPKSETSLDLPEQELLTNAKRQFSNSLYSVSKESFRALKTNYPTGPYADFAQIKIADSLFFGGDYADSLKAYEEYAKDRPSSLASPYVLLMAGRSAELTSGGVGRDPGPFQRAIGFYDEVIKRFPDSIYTAAARQRRQGLLNILAAYDLELIKFYETQGKDEIAAQRSADFLKAYKTNAEDFETLDYDKRAEIPESALNIEEISAARDYARKLPITVAVSVPTSNNFNAPIEKSKVEQQSAIGSFRIQSLKCDSDSDIITIRLGPEPVQLVNNLKTVKKSNEFELAIRGLDLGEDSSKTFSCFTEGDLTISASSKTSDADTLIRLKSEKSSASAFFADNPARIIIKLR